MLDTNTTDILIIGADGRRHGACAAADADGVGRHRHSRGPLVASAEIMHLLSAEH